MIVGCILVFLGIVLMTVLAIMLLVGNALTGALMIAMAALMPLCFVLFGGYLVLREFCKTRKQAPVFFSEENMSKLFQLFAELQRRSQFPFVAESSPGGGVLDSITYDDARPCALTMDGELKAWHYLAYFEFGRLFRELDDVGLHLQYSHVIVYAARPQGESNGCLEIAISEIKGCKFRFEAGQLYVLREEHFDGNQA